MKPPVFLTSTFPFSSGALGRRFFELAYGLRQRAPGEAPGLIYSRINNPNLQIFEERMVAWDRTEAGASFASGMAAISTTALALLRPGDHVISTVPIDGGTHFLFEHILPDPGIGTTPVLDRFEVFRLAVSRGGTESLVEHPMTMTHSEVPPETLDRYGVTPGLIRVSVGLEHLSDLRRDLEWALGE